MRRAAPVAVPCSTFPWADLGVLHPGTRAVLASLPGVATAHHDGGGPCGSGGSMVPGNNGAAS